MSTSGFSLLNNDNVSTNRLAFVQKLQAGVKEENAKMDDLYRKLIKLKV